MIDETKWFYLKDGKSVGPFTKDQLVQMALAETILKETLIWNPIQNEQWKQVQEVFDLRQTFPPPLPTYSITQVVDKEPSFPQTVNSIDKPHPWRRYFARMLDNTANGSVMWVAIGTIFVSILPNEAKRFFEFAVDPKYQLVNSFLTFLLVPFVNAAFIGFTGSSLGKWFFGVKIVDSSNRAIGYSLALKREFLVWLYGLGLGIPIVSFLTSLKQKSQLEKDGITQWDKDLDLKVIYRADRWSQHLLSLLGFSLIFVIYGLVTSF